MKNKLIYIFQAIVIWVNYSFNNIYNLFIIIIIINLKNVAKNEQRH